MEIGFDELLEVPQTPENSFSISVNADYIAFSTPETATYIERVDTNKSPAIKLFSNHSSTMGFFGQDKDLLVTAVKTDDPRIETLRIIQVYNMQQVFSTRIRSGSLFVPESSKSPYIGIVTPAGNAYMINDRCETIDMNIEIPENYNVLWSSTVRPVGYTWTDHDGDNSQAYIYIKSSPNEADNGSLMTSSSDVTIWTVWSNSALKRHEAYITTADTPHILRRVSSSPERAVVENIVSLDKGVEISHVVTLPNGKPSIVVANDRAKVIAEIIPPETDTSEMLQKIITDQHRMTLLNPIGVAAFSSWTQTPITPPVASITNYKRMGHPRHEVKQSVKSGLNYDIPVTNTVRELITDDKETVRYRILSPYPIRRHTSSSIVIIPDKDGRISAGAYSPTVSRLYEEGVPVALVPYRKGKSEKDALEDLAYDLVDVSHHLTKTHKVARTPILMANEEMCVPAMRAFQHKKSNIEKLLLINPNNRVFGSLRKKELRQVVSAYFNVNEDDIENPSKYNVIYSDDDIHSFIVRNVL